VRLDVPFVAWGLLRYPHGYLIPIEYIVLRRVGLFLSAACGWRLDFLVLEYETVCRANFPKGCFEAVRVADVSEEVGDTGSASEHEWD